MAHPSIRMQKAQAALQYAAPAIILLYYLSSIISAVITLQIGHKNKQNRLRQITIWCVRLILFTYLAQCADLVVDSLSAHPTTSTLAANVNAASSTLLWFLVNIILQSTRRPVWYPYLGACIITLAFEAAIFSLFISQLSKGKAAGFAFVVSHVCRFAVLLLILAVHQKTRMGIKYSQSDEESAASLLQHQLRSAPIQDGTAKPAGNYGSVVVIDAAYPESSDSEDSEDDDLYSKAAKKKQRLMNERLQQDGNWFTYLRGFSLFVPMVWPTKRPRLYLNMLGCVVCVLCIRVLQVLQPRQLGILVNTLASGSGSIYQGIGLYLFYFWISSVIDTLQESLWLPVEQHADKQISVGAYNQIMELSSDFHDNKQSGDLYQTISQGRSIITLLRTVCWRIGPMLLDILVGYGYLYHLFGPYMALLAAATTLAYLSSAAQLNSKVSKYRREYIGLFRKEMQTMYDSVGSWATVLYFNHVPYEEKRYEGAVSLNMSARRLYYLVHNIFSQMSSSIVTLGFYGALCPFPLAPLKSFASTHKEILSDLVDAEQLLHLFRLEPKIKDGATKFVMKGGAIEFSNVYFSYEGTKQIIKGVSFSVKPGGKIALVGETGGGKSTLLKLLFRFYDVTEGSVLIDGQDVRGVTLESLRSCIGVVPQDPSMFNDTIMNNVRYSKLEATDEEVMEACKAAVVHDKILSFTDGYQSTVGEKGVKLSGGELQRLAIARAILKDPAIILLDEATSSVDTDTESRIQSALHRLTKGRTTFTVAHRLSTVVDADIVLVIKDGEIVEQGPPNELIAAKNEYYSLWCKQVGITSKMMDTTDTTKQRVNTRSESEQAQSGTSEGKKMFRPDAPEFIPSHLKDSTFSSAPAGKQKVNTNAGAKAGSSEQPQDEMDNATNLEAETRGKGQQARGNDSRAVQDDSQAGTAEEAGGQAFDETKTANHKSAATRKHADYSRVRRRKTSKSEQGDSSVSIGDGHVDTTNTTPESSGEGSATQYRRVSAPSTSTDNGKTNRRIRQNGHKWGRKRNTNSVKTQSAPGTWSGIPQPVAPAPTPENNGEGESKGSVRFAQDS
ncbi:MAG: hypothetical protein L6R38_003806 [Xanthoria sp. 2 TBL-2021]|nr:MAG: hypothetical protein L6R38_003806 [Xanthoria sp. 2 TBL-2021]